MTVPALTQQDAVDGITRGNFKAAAFDTTVGSSAGDLDFSSGVATAPTSGMYRLKVMTNAIRFRTGNDAVATDTHLAAGEFELVELEKGERISAIRDGSSDATINLVKTRGL